MAVTCFKRYLFHSFTRNIDESLQHFLYLSAACHLQERLAGKGPESKTRRFLDETFARESRWQKPNN